jgi:hypothetical protein
VTKIIKRTQNATDAKKFMPNTFIDEELRERIIMNKLLSHGHTDKERFAEIQKENLIMLEKLYKIQNRKISSKKTRKTNYMMIDQAQQQKTSFSSVGAPFS